MAAAYRLLFAPVLSRRKLSLTSCRAGEYLVLGSVCDKRSWTISSLVPNVLICALPLCLALEGSSSVHSDVLLGQPRKAKFASHMVSDSSGIHYQFSTWETKINHCSADPRLSHFTSLWCSISYSAQMSSRNCWNCQWYRALQWEKLTFSTENWIMMYWSSIEWFPSLPTFLQNSMDNPLHSLQTSLDEIYH